MKQCPNCKRTFGDVDLKFCLDDGTELVLKAESEVPATAVMPDSENRGPETIKVSAAPVSPAPTADIPPTVAAQGNANSSLVPIIVGVVVLLGLGLVILVTASFFPWRDSFVGYFLTRVARRLPMVLLALGGIAFAGFRWKRHSRASLITIVALAIYLLDLVVYNAILYWIPSVVDSMRMSVSASRFFWSVVYFIEDCVTAAIIILLVVAAFIGRTATRIGLKREA